MATSNRHPDKLYENGLNRDIIFEPFVSQLKRFCVIHDMGNSSADYRIMNAEKELNGVLLDNANHSSSRDLGQDTYFLA